MPSLPEAYYRQHLHLGTVDFARAEGLPGATGWRLFITRTGIQKHQHRRRRG